MREFTTSVGSVLVVGSLTLIFLNPIGAPNLNIEILRLWTGQSGSTTSAQQQVQVHTQVSPFPVLTAATPAKLKRADAVSLLIGSTTGAAGTSGVNATTDTSGAQTVVFGDAFNVLNGWLYVPTPAETIVVPAGSLSGLGLKFPVAPSSLLAWAIGCNFREV